MPHGRTRAGHRGRQEGNHGEQRDVLPLRGAGPEATVRFMATIRARLRRPGAGFVLRQTELRR
jgi:hypothetical protein